MCVDWFWWQPSFNLGYAKKDRVNKHGNGKFQCSIGNASSSGPCSIAILPDLCITCSVQCMSHFNNLGGVSFYWAIASKYNHYKFITYCLKFLSDFAVKKVALQIRVVSNSPCRFWGEGRLRVRPVTRLPHLPKKVVPRDGCYSQLYLWETKTLLVYHLKGVVKPRSQILNVWSLYPNLGSLGR